MPEWSNWSGKLTASPEEIVFIRSEADAAAVANGAVRQGRRIRVAGATHSHAPLVQHDDIIVDASGLSGVISVDTTNQSAWVWAGSRICTLGRPLHDAGFALVNQGDIDRQAIAGATATGTHGTGVNLKNLSSAVTGAVIATASGDLVTCSADQNPDLWQAARLHLGALGIVTRLQLQLTPAYRLKEQAWQANLADTLDSFHSTAVKHRHHEFFWYPQTDQANGKSIDVTDDAPSYPLAAEGHRCAWSYEVLPNHRPHKHTEMEYSVPAEEGPACMDAIRQLLADKFTNVRWPVEYRTLAADDVWMSTAYERATVTISVHEDIRADDEPYFRACEEVFLNFSGRPHWGKVHYLNGTQLAGIHPRWADWWQVRNDIDPEGTFLNDHMAAMR